jgi:hypothetical protein
VIAWWWSYLLATIGIFGLWAAGSKKAWGWLIGLGVQLLWMAYAIGSEQYGFILSALAYAIVYARNYDRWQRSG